MRGRWFCFLLPVTPREGALYTLAFCTLFLARMVNTLLTGAALRSCIILSPLFLLPIERRLLSTVPRRLVFYLFFSLSLRLSPPSTDSLCPSIHSVSQLFDPFSSARWCCHLSNLSIILLYSFLYLFRFSVLFSEHGSTNWWEFLFGGWGIFIVCFFLRYEGNKKVR